MSNKTETTLFTTEATQQKQHTTQNHSILIRCHFGPLLVFATCIGVRTLHVTVAVGRFIFQHQPTYSQLVAYHDGHSRLHRMQRGNPKKGSCSRQVFVMPGDGKLLGRDIQGSPDQGTKKSEGRQRSIHCRQL